MIQKDYYKTRKDGVVLNKIYSDEGRFVICENNVYDYIIDLADSDRAYTEGDVMPIDEAAEKEEKALAYDILMGVAQ